MAADPAQSPGEYPVDRDEFRGFYGPFINVIL